MVFLWSFRGVLRVPLDSRQPRSGVLDAFTFNVGSCFKLRIHRCPNVEMDLPLQQSQWRGVPCSARRSIHSSPSLGDDCSIAWLSLGHFQVGSYRYRSLNRRSIYLVEALWKPYIP